MLPPHLQKLVDNPKTQKIYKKLQHEQGVKLFGKEHTIREMKEKYSSKGKALSKLKK